MLKTTLKYTVLFIAIASFAAITASCAYIITKNLLAEKASVERNTVKVLPEYTAQATSTPVPTSFDFYLVKLDGNNLDVYASQDNKLEFLYNTTIYAADLGQQDITLLSEGVKLKNSSELTEFIENYTS